jgi:DNA-binding LacI/PurR family transcriptional regulator
MTAIRPSKSRVGRVAVEMMVSRLVEGKRRPPQRVLVLPELVIRNSSVNSSAPMWQAPLGDGAPYA